MDAQPHAETQRDSSLANRWFSARGFSVILSVLIVAAFADVIFGWRTFFYRDFGIFAYPLAYYHRESFWQGEIPLWNPYNNSGIPFLAQWNTMVLYPFSLFYALFPLSWSLGVFCLLHLFFAGLGMHRLVEHWTAHRLAACIAGIAFAFNGLTLSCLKWPNNIAALAWMPWVVLLAECGWQRGGRWIFFAALAAGMQMLTGGPEIILFTWGITLTLSATDLIQRAVLSKKASALLRTFRPMFVALPTIALLAAAIAAAQLLPFVDLLKYSQRGAAYGDASWAMPLWGGANFLLPLFRCFPSHQGVFAQPGQYWISSYYIGGFVLIAAAFGLWFRRREARVWVVAATAFVCLLLALGPDGMLYAWLSKYVAPIRIIRFPIKFVVPVIFVLPVLAGLAIASMSQSSTRTLRGLLGGGLTCVVLMLALLIFNDSSPATVEHSPIQRQNAFMRIAALLAALGLLITFLRHTKLRMLAAAGLLIALWIDLITHAPRLSPTIEPWVYEPDLAKTKLALNPTPELGHSRAMLSPWADFRMNHLALTNAVDDHLFSRFSLFANVNLLDRLPKVDGFFSLTLEEENRVRYLLYASTNASNPQLEDFLGVSQRTAPEKLIQWQPRTNFMPFATAGQTAVFLNGPDTLRALADPKFDPRTTVFLEPIRQTNAMPRLPSPTDSTTRTINLSESAIVRPVKIQSAHIELEVATAQPAWVVINQSYYHPWHAYVNGTETTLHRANHAFQAVSVGAGKSKVELIYKDRAFQLGASISMTALLVCVVGLWFRRQNAP